MYNGSCFQSGFAQPHNSGTMGSVVIAIKSRQFYFNLSIHYGKYEAELLFDFNIYLIRFDNNGAVRCLRVCLRFKGEFVYTIFCVLLFIGITTFWKAWKVIANHWAPRFFFKSKPLIEWSIFPTTKKEKRRVAWIGYGYCVFTFWTWKVHLRRKFNCVHLINLIQCTENQNQNNKIEAHFR